MENPGFGDGVFHAGQELRVLLAAAQSREPRNRGTKNRGRLVAPLANSRWLHGEVLKDSHQDREPRVADATLDVA
jgi:hypothetical protein